MRYPVSVLVSWLQEARITAHLMGFPPLLISDVGVAGLHRLLRQVRGTLL